MNFLLRLMYLDHWYTTENNKILQINSIKKINNRKKSINTLIFQIWQRTVIIADISPLILMIATINTLKVKVKSLSCV